MGRILIPLADLEYQNPKQAQFKIEQGLAEKKADYGTLEISWEFSECPQVDCSHLNPNASQNNTRGKLLKPNFSRRRNLRPHHI